MPSPAKVRSAPCGACPYRSDAPSGVWDAGEYDKLEAYDRPTAEQPPAPFGCHATPEHYCHGWAIVHSARGHENELLALRVARLTGAWDGELPAPAVALFSSGEEAATHGKAEVERPSPAATRTIARLRRKYPRLRGS